MEEQTKTKAKSKYLFGALFRFIKMVQANKCVGRIWETISAMRFNVKFDLVDWNLALHRSISFRFNIYDLF